ncbi:MAG: hypothetical protein NZZ41_02300 [Candidatus Dojkabacteria bacterium]|nr:hypothetical protein [Candidatus Dojkabacteria bacterium]
MIEQELELNSIKSPFDVNFEDPDGIIGVKDDDPVIRIERRTQEFKSNFGQSSPLLAIVREEIGADYVLSGDPDNPIQISLYDLNDKQLADLLRYKYQEDLSQELEREKNYDLDNFEIDLINAIRSGDNEKALLMLGVNPYENLELTDDEVIEWKVRSLYPNMSEEEIAEEIDIWKQSPNSDKKLLAARQELMNEINSYQEEEQMKQQLERERIMNEEAEHLISMIDDIDSLYQFEVDDDVKRDMYDLIFSKVESGKSKIVEMMDDPVGLLEIAASVAIMPKVAGYVNQLLNVIDELKKNRQIVVDSKNAYNSRQLGSFGRIEDGVEDVSKYFRLA